eukprot:TRINITY_DN1782_c0_g1_i1.p1 TRINITY_DN1782_c0_g1~~TRINITY_DN1782_c0_g1_i1.p1  ORF type:complete len:250 (-),score=25.57 TRINITY_DN1782_c0_g1_i1:260-1009(-)
MASFAILSSHGTVCLPAAHMARKSVSSTIPSTFTQLRFTRKHYPYQQRSTITFNTFRTLPACSATSIPETEKNADALVETLLSMVQNSDRGAKLSKEEQETVANTISDLERYCIDEPLASPLIFGEWDVEYSSNPTSTGGYYRSALGRLVLETKSMIQVLQAPNVVQNKVAFRAIHQINGEVSLEGTFTALSNTCIEIKFEPPKLVLGPFNLQYGADSKVKISILYLDEKVRIGRGSRGSIFIFKRRNT